MAILYVGAAVKIANRLNPTIAYLINLIILVLSVVLHELINIIHRPILEANSGINMNKSIIPH